MLSVLSSCLTPSTFGPHVLQSGVPFDGLSGGGPLFIHGYNSPLDVSVPEFKGFSDQLRLRLNATLYVWPGGNNPIDFVSAVSRATIAGYRLRDVLSMTLVPDTIISHSLGARVALTALKDGRVPVKKLILLGAAVDCDALDREFSMVVGECREIHILYSRKDPILRVFFPMGDVHGEHRALGYCGPDCKLPSNVFSHDVSSLVKSHKGYMQVPECVTAISDLIGSKVD